MVLAEASAVVTTLKSASDLLNQLRKSDDRDALRNGIAALTDMLINARSAALDLQQEKAALLDQIRSLEEKLRNFDDFNDLSGRYERVQTSRGKFVYRERNPIGGVSGAPYFCPTCFSAKKASVLQQRQGDSFAVCHTCRWGEYL